MKSKIMQEISDLMCDAAGGRNLKPPPECDLAEAIRLLESNGYTVFAPGELQTGEQVTPAEKDSPGAPHE